MGYFEQLSMAVDGLSIKMSNAYLKLKGSNTLRSGNDHMDFHLKNPDFVSDPYRNDMSQDARPNFKTPIYKDEQQQIQNAIPNMGGSMTE